MFGRKDQFKKFRSKEREALNLSNIENDRFKTGRKKNISKLNSTTYAHSYADSFRFKRDHESLNNIDVETYSDPNTSNSNILNVISPNEKQGFHITDLLDQSKFGTKQSKQLNNLQNNEGIFDERNYSSEAKVNIVPFSSANKQENKYVIKNFKLINMSDFNQSRISDKINKPITAAPVSYNDSGARAIKKITSEGERRTRFVSTSDAFRNAKSPSNLPVSNSLLSHDEKGMYVDMRPVGEYFDQMFEETHYMFPKHKTKFGVRINNQTTYPKNKSLSRVQPTKIDITDSNLDEVQRLLSQSKIDENDPIIKELREKSSRFVTPKYRTNIMRKEQEMRDRVELEHLLKESLKYHKEQLSK